MSAAGERVNKCRVYPAPGRRASAAGGASGSLRPAGTCGGCVARPCPSALGLAEGGDRTLQMIGVGLRGGSGRWTLLSPVIRWLGVAFRGHAGAQGCVSARWKYFSRVRQDPTCALSTSFMLTALPLACFPLRKPIPNSRAEVWGKCFSPCTAPLCSGDGPGFAVRLGHLRSGAEASFLGLQRGLCWEIRDC